MVVNMASLTSMLEAVVGAACGLGRWTGACALSAAAQAANTSKITQILSQILFGISSLSWATVPCNSVLALAGS